jgi:hypothetical protein
MADLQVSERADDAQCARLGPRSLSVRCAEAEEKWCRQKRHVASYHQHLFRWRADARRIQTTQRSSPDHAICDDRHPGGLSVRRLAADNQDMRGNRAEHRELPFGNRRGADCRDAVVAPAATSPLATGQYCC